MKIFLSSVLLCAATVSAFAQPTAVELLEQKTLERIRAVNTSLNGVLGFHAIDLTSGRSQPERGAARSSALIYCFSSAR